jgi:hypothetical protein
MLPTLVIGLGGTGSWATAYLKQRLLSDSHWGLLEGGPSAITRADYDRNPWPVELKAIDVDRKRRPVVGGLKLEKAVEDIQLTAPVGKTITDIANIPGAYPTIQKWMPREEAKGYDINEAALYMTEGLGQIRQFGRVAFFYEQVNSAQELSKLDAAFARLTKGDDIQVFVVASVAGGTGGGLLIDTLGYLSAQRAKLPGQISVRATGFIVLPGGFAGELAGDKYALAAANGLAALRELDRLLNAPETVEFEWRPGVTTTLDRAALDFCYLVDGSREQGGAEQLDRYKPVEQALPVGIGDALYAHLFPSTGAILGRDYANYTAPLIGGAENRYASFGSYVITYDWENLMGSLGLRALGEVLAALRAPAADFGRQQVTGFLATGATGALALGEQQQAVPALATSGLSAIPDPPDLVLPGAGWLTPSDYDYAARVPSTPHLADSFPGIKVMRTAYTNPQVVADAEEIVAAFRGPGSAVWAGGTEPRFFEAINHNIAQSAGEWRRALVLASAAIMNSNNRIGGGSAAREFLVSIELKLELLGSNLSKATQPDLTPYRRALEEAEEAMHDGRTWDDWKEQKDYIAARQDLLEEETNLACYQATSELIGTLAGITAEVKERVAGWDLTLEHLAGLARDARLTTDDERHKANQAPLRRYVPQPGEPVEQALYTECWGTAVDGRTPDGLLAMLAAMHWTVPEVRQEALRIKLAHPAFSNADREVKLADLRAATLAPFMSLRTRSLFEVFERADESPEALAAEIRTSMHPLATYDPAQQLLATGGAAEFKNADYVFGYWPSEQNAEGAGGSSQPGGALSQRLRSLLGEMGVSTEDLAAGLKEGNYPTRDKLIAYALRPLMALNAFTGVQALESAYKARRDIKPPTHLLPEERGAAQLEMVSEQHVREGLIKQPLPRLGAADVGYCADERFLIYVASALAAGALTYEQEDPFNPASGRWYVTAQGSRLELAADPDFGAVLIQLIRPANATLEQARDALQAAGATAARSEGARERLLALARDGWKGHGPLPSSLMRVLQVAAATGAKELRDHRHHAAAGAPVEDLGARRADRAWEGRP